MELFRSSKSSLGPPHLAAFLISFQCESLFYTPLFLGASESFFPGCISAGSHSCLNPRGIFLKLPSSLCGLQSHVPHRAALSIPQNHPRLSLDLRSHASLPAEMPTTNLDSFSLSEAVGEVAYFHFFADCKHQPFHISVPLSQPRHSAPSHLSQRRHRVISTT